MDPLFSGDCGDRSPTRRRGLRRALLGLSGLGIVAAAILSAAPRILSSAAVLRWILARANSAQEEAAIEIEDWSWRWRAPCRIEGLSIRKTDQSATLHVQSITLSNGLLSWLGGVQRFGSITVESPRMSILDLPSPAVADSKSLPVPVPPETPPAPSRKTSGDPAPVAHRASSAGNTRSRLNPVGDLAVRNGQATVFPQEGPPVRIADVQMSLRLAGRDGPVAFSLESDLPRRHGQAPVSTGRISVDMRADSLSGLLADAVQTPFEARAVLPAVDLSALDAFLPPDPTRPRMESGLLEARVSATKREGQPVDLQGSLGLQQLRMAGGALGGDVVIWDQAGASLEARLGQGQVDIRDFQMQSPWFKGRAYGTMNTAETSPEGTLTAEGQLDLAALAGQLPGTLHLQPGLTLKRGLLRFDAEASAGPEGTRVFALLRCDGLDAEQDGRILNVDLPFTLGMNADLTPAGQVRQARLQLASPVATMSVEGRAQAGSAKGEVDLGALTETLETIVSIDPAQRTAGRITLDGTWRDEGDGLSLAATVKGDRLWRAGTGDRPVQIDTARIQADATVVRAAGLETREFRNVSLEATLPFAELRTSAELIRTGEFLLRGVTLSLDARSAPLLELAGGDPEAALAEQVAISAAGDLSAEQLDLRSFRVATGPFDLSGHGSLTVWTGERRLLLEGRSRIDLDALQVLLRQRELDGIVLSGISDKPFRLSAPLGGGRRFLLSGLHLEAGVLARHLAGLGLQAENTEVNAAAADGVLRLSALSTVNEGAFRLEPQVDLLAEPPVLTLPRNARVLDNARLTDEMLDQQLARIHPILKGCSVSGGRVTLDVPQASIPMAPDALHRMDWTATFHLREVSLAAAGPLQQAAAALRLRQTEVTLTNQTLTVSCREGRLYPQPLDLQLGGYSVRVAGSVGLDGSLDYRVELPITEPLVGPQAFRYLEGQTVSIPLAGTAGRPVLDLRGLEAEIRRLVADTATRAVTETVREQIQEQVKGPLQERIRELDPSRLDDALRRLRR